MTILVTGAGMIGSQIARELLERGEAPILFDVAPQLDNISRIIDLSKVKMVRGDVLDPLQLIRVISAEKIDKIIHTAIIFGMTGAMEKEPYPGIRLNILGTANVLEAARLTGVKRVVLTSTNAMYARPIIGDEGQPIKEDFTIKVLSGRSKSPYATSKLVCEWLGFNYLDNCGIDFVAVRFAGAFGPWLGPISGITGYRFRDAIEDALKGKTVVISAKTGWMPADPVYSKDAANGAILACLCAKPLQRVYNISMGRIYGLTEVAEILRKLHPRAKIEVKEEQTSGIQAVHLAGDISKAQDELGYKPKYMMESALEDFTNWIRSNASR